ncbi:serine/threonine protein kinase [Rippkaea orientalis PCC 8801]|uniref:non-specific serine/threonine protein kinase n=1 Tax=Rippkaea orientalis (strain PCC 8801 / RF-1) TaxID=41431 RepID=B7JX05_RIPO1|nr:bifunctional serine/threonine-protein kinase/formylglycine-generating enzyme family protein [Rippkaea orientalis]ACK65854.1 serine/threonine protein kinase [Rippkaea orientalis PCC 8801]
MLYCLNPNCSDPENSQTNQRCQGCGENLQETCQDYVFRVHYRIIQKLGEGAFGRTYLAEEMDCKNEPRVIKKLVTAMQGSMFTKAKELFEREAEKLYQLNHSKIPKFYAYFEYEKAFYLVQEFIDGDNLFNEVWQQGAFNEEKIQHLLTELLPILIYLHDQKILHRDIKPENIMRRRSPSSGGNYGDLVLIDFGASKQLNTTMQPIGGSRIYTPGYAAIEQIMGQPQPASDIYSLAATAVRLLTRYFPQEDEYNNLVDELCVLDVMGVKWQWKEYAAKQGITISQNLVQVLDKMLEPALDNRYQSAQQVLDDLNKFINITNNIPTTPKFPSPAKTVLSPPPVENTKNTGLGQGLQKLFSLSNSKKILQNTTGNNLKTFSFEVVQVNRRGEIINRQQKQAQYFRETLAKNVELDMVSIPGGTFWMGTDDEEIERLVKKFNWDYFRREKPQHQVRVPSFYMGKYPVTQAQWKAIAALDKIDIDLKPTPSYFKGDQRPVEQVSWYDCVEFCKRLSKLTRKDYQLSSEAQWEYACRSEKSELTLAQWNEKLDGVTRVGKGLPERSLPT